MKKLFVVLMTMMLSVTAFHALGRDWTKTFVVISGEEPVLNLAKGDYVKVTEYNYTTIGGNSYRIEIPLKMSEVDLTERDGGMSSMTSATFIYSGQKIKVAKSTQAAPDWMRIGGCELREKR